MKLKRAKPSALRKVRDLLRNATLLPTPEPEAVDRILTALADMGIHDEPEWEGISSSVKQYALSAASADDPELKFATVHPGLLAHADALKTRFGLRPIHFLDVMLEAGRDKGDA